MQQKVSYKTYVVFCILTLIYVVFAIRYSPFFENLGSDKEVFQYIGMIINNNQYPYTHAFDHKPPIIYLVNYLGVLVTPKSTWGVFIILNSLGLFCTILFYKMATKTFKGLLLPILISVAFLIINNSNYILQEGNLTRQLAAYFTTIILFIVFSNKKSSFKSFLVGALIGIIFFTQQNEILGGLILSAYYLLFSENIQFNNLKKILRNIGLFTLGLIIPFLGILLIINYWNNYEDFLYQVFFFNFNSYIDERSLFTKVFGSVFSFSKIVFINKVLLVVVLVIIINLITHIKNKNKKIDSKVFVLLFALIFQIFSTSISGKDYIHYFLMFIPYVISIFIFSWHQNNYKHLKYFSVLLIAVFVFHAVKTLPYKKSDKSLLKAITAEVSDVENKTGQFYSLNGRYLRVNFNLNVLSPSKHIYAHFMNEEVAEEIIKDLNRNTTKYILYDSDDAHIIPNSLKRLLTSNYEVILRYQNHILYERLD